MLKNKKTSTKQTVSNGVNTPKTRAMILCVLFGMFGIHKFYQGKIIAGIIRLILGCSGLIPSLMILLPIAVIISGIDLLLLVVDKNNSNGEFIYGSIALLVFIGFNPIRAIHKTNVDTIVHLSSLSRTGK